MSIELDLLHVLKSVEGFNKYQKYIKPDSISTEAGCMVEAMGAFHRRYGKDVTDLDDFYTWLVTVHLPTVPEKERKFFRACCDRLKTHSLSDSADEVIMRFECMAFAERVLPMVEQLAKDGDPDTLHDIKDILTVTYDEVASTGEEKFVKTPIADIIAKHVSGGGYEWRFEEMNLMAGPVRPGDFIIVFGRPETGKTSFVCSEVTHWAAQMAPDDKIVFFNNEEEGDKIWLRTYTTALGVTASKLASLKDPESALKSALGGDRVLVYDDNDVTTYDVERICLTIQPKVVVFNVLEKVVGFSKDDETKRLKNLAKWARGLGKKYGCIVVAVWQADAAAEGERYLRKHQMYASKTGAPSEADLIIGIGATFDPAEEDFRFFHLSKNKLTGGPRSLPKRKHGYAVALFDSETGRYTNVPPGRAASAPTV